MSGRLFIFGDGNFADMAHYLFSTDSAYEVAGFTVDAAFLKRERFNGLPVIAYEALRRSADRSQVTVYVAIGVSGVNAVRAAKVAQVQADGFRLASFVSSHARVPPGFAAQANTMIMDQVNIHPKVQIGADTVVWSNSRIALNAQIGNHVVRAWGARPWRFSALDYEAAAAGSSRTRRDLDDSCIVASWDAALAPAMQRHGLAIAEEAVAASLLADLRQD